VWGGAHVVHRHSHSCTAGVLSVGATCRGSRWPAVAVCDPFMLLLATAALELARGSCSIRSHAHFATQPLVCAHPSCMRRLTPLACVVLLTCALALLQSGWSSILEGHERSSQHPQLFSGGSPRPLLQPHLASRQDAARAPGAVPTGGHGGPQQAKGEAGLPMAAQDTAGLHSPLKEQHISGLMP
jgi:hypothetical protein